MPDCNQTKAIYERVESIVGNFDSERINLINEAATYGNLFKMNGDEDRFNKITSFGRKLLEAEYVIGFAGHFSAGKSSMINALTGVDLLPSSPIPTSANIVKVRKSEKDYAIIHLTDGRAVKYGGHGFSDAIKSFSKDGAAVSLVEIGHKSSSLPEGITVMDTPGVDSTDDAHRLSTESALHLADHVFYTMDYNHVQSELNFSFTKELKRYNPNVYLIINQIDKHRESEISFEQFKQSVKNSFNMWGVEPRGIFYTSLFEHDHVHNDFDKVKEIVDGSMENWQERFIHNASNTIEKLRDEHQVFLQEEIGAAKSTYREVVADDEWTKKELFINDLQEAEKTLELFTEGTFSLNFERQRNELLNNAAITPYETRELLKQYLESLSSRFKVGFLFGAKKTAEEREKREQAFFTNIQQLIHTQIEVHLKTLMKKLLKEASILTDERSLAIDAMNLDIPFSTIVKQFNTSDVMTGDTILNYANQMKANITLAFRQLTDEWKREMSDIISTSGKASNGELQPKIDNLNEKIHAIGLVYDLTQRLEMVTEEIENPSNTALENRDELIGKWKQKEILELTDFHAIVSEATETDEVIEETAAGTEAYQRLDANAVKKRAQHVATTVKEIPGFTETARYLYEKAERLEGQEFTVALFGAFSAGKSSFSNALIGEDILPVSPNPTTATINRIRPIKQGKEDGTADVILKTTERMTEDIIRSFEAIGVNVTSLNEAFEKVDEALNIELEEEKLQVHKAFIAAFQRGYPVYERALGTTLNVVRDEFVKFVAEEERSCFVDAIDFYFDCELTRKGITLVDTPGADSINARHTDVAFDYIRNADAILFVTYYNHAFARADREFLIQLGRVKDAFELDKMFFIVNAIDLAKNEEEALEVKTFVGNELQKFGIRHPRVHGISSLQALSAKVENLEDPFMAPFEKEFHQFLEQDLRGLAIQSLEEETMKTTDRLASLISRTALNMKRKSERFEELATLEQSVRKKYEQSFASVLKTSSTNELGELVHYIFQRVFLRFTDFIKEAYNPSVFASKSTENALKGALEETVNMVGFDLTQELKVTNLRIFNFLTKQLNERQRIETIALKKYDETFAPTIYEPKEMDMLTFPNPFTDPTVYKTVNKLFRNERTFFERGERDKLKEQLEELLKRDAAIYLKQENERLDKWVKDWIDEEAEALRNHLLKECLNQLQSERTLLEGTDKLDEWRSIYEKIQMKELV